MATKWGIVGGVGDIPLAASAVLNKIPPQSSDGPNWNGMEEADWRSKTSAGWTCTLKNNPGVMKSTGHALASAKFNDLRPCVVVVAQNDR